MMFWKVRVQSLGGGFGGSGAGPRRGSRGFCCEVLHGSVPVFSAPLGFVREALKVLLQ